GDEPRVFAEYTRGIPRLRRTPIDEPLFQRVAGDLDVELPAGHVDDDDVAVANRRHRPAARCFGRDMPDTEASGRPGEAAVGDERDRLAETGPYDRAGHGQH